MENEVLIERAKAFVQTVAAQAPWAEIEPYYAPDVSQEEFPNRLLPKGTVRNLEALRDASAKGRKVIKADHRDWLALPMQNARARAAERIEFWRHDIIARGTSCRQVGPNLRHIVGDDVHAVFPQDNANHA